MNTKTLLIAIIYCCSMSPLSGQFFGGTTDGYASMTYNSPLFIYTGGTTDGYALSSYSNPSSIFLGGSRDGSYTADYGNQKSIYKGGARDGYASDSKLLQFIWSGNIGSGWNVSGNWLNGIIPDINSRVVIPSGANHYPAINAGTMTIGQAPIPGDFLCKQIEILDGAEMTFRINAFLENYGSMEILGNVYVLNTAIDAVKNLSGGLIYIRNGGQLSME